MAKQLLLDAEVRTEMGTKASRRFRAAGKMPAIVYGHGQEPVSVLLNSHDVVEGLHHGHRVIDIKVNGKKETVLFKELQYDYLGKEIVHADLIRVDVTERVVVNVSLELKGTPKGAEEGGVLNEHLGSLEVECVVTDIPTSIEVSVKGLGVGESIHAGDVELPEGVTLVSDETALIANCSVVAEEPTEEEMAEEIPEAPEVIGEKKGDEEGKDEE